MFKRGRVAVVAAGLVLAVGGCGGGVDGKAGTSDRSSAGPAPTRPPSEELVQWVGGLCGATTTLKNLRKDSAADLKEIRKAQKTGPSAELLAMGYLSGTPDTVETVDRDLKQLGRSGVPAADRLLAAWLKKLETVLPELVDVSPAAAMDDAGGSAAEVDTLVQSLTPPEPDLPALTKKDPRLAAAHERAKQCAAGWEPGGPGGGTGSPAPDHTGPLPEAADGENTGACSDGACEVLVTSTADITANGVSVHVTVADEFVTFRTEGTVMQLGGAGGEAGFGDELKAVVVAHDEDGAVLKFSIP
ncbi:MAG TPA: hypothetical protein VN520_00010 [Streptomyces sp.]|uniref:hypothetical protein n=1 Tax=Streptomyces sp. TaxID=1931 RepID=UPI002BC3A9E0|nr:hypothetical protein [Streptomyces sp.]HWU04792.1 hypothetical protein [Streptomyces sp.]